MNRRHYFLSSPSVLPSTRWREAFPDGVIGEMDMLLATANAGEVIWVPTAHVGWEAQLVTLARGLPDCPLAVVSYAPFEEEAVSALNNGARAYCHALSVPAMLCEVDVVLQHGGLWVGRELMAKVVGAAARALPATEDESLLQILSAREAEVARAAATGLSNKEIAMVLGISERTVKAHMGAVFEKLGVRDRLQLVLRLSAPSAPERTG